MTCIVGIEKGNSVWLGGDSAGTAGDLSQKQIGDPKVFVKDKFAFGVCGLPKVMDAIRYNIEMPQHPSGMGDRQFINSVLVPALRDGLRTADCLEKGHPLFGGEEEQFHGAVLIGYRAKLYRLESNFQIITDAFGFDSVGSGSDIAIGSLHASKDVGDPRKRIIMALEASAIGNAAVRPPFTIVQLKKRFWQ